MDCLEASDRIGLPESYLQEIVQAGEQFRGPLLFEVKTRLGRKRHCSVAGQFFPDLLPGHAILPRWVMDDLAIAEAEEVTLRQVSLDLVSFVRIQAHSACFYDAARGHNIPALLKESLVRCSALTEDTCVQVFVDGQSFQFQVVELQPKAAVRLIDTNMEEYFEFKVDFEAPPDEEDEAKRRSYQESDAWSSSARGSRRPLRRQAEDLQARLEAAREALLRAERQRLAGLAAAGGVAAAAGATVEVALKLPDGTRMRERFREGTALAAVALLALESDWARSVCPCGVQLSCPGLRAASMELEAPITRDMHRSQLNAAPVRAPDDSELLRIGVDGREQLPRAHEGAADTAGDAAARPPGPPRLERQVSLVQRRTLEAFEAQRFVQAGIPPEEALRRVREGESLPPSAASLRRGAAASAQPALGRTSSQEDLVQQVVEFTAVSRELAAQRLEEAGWNVQEAINAILSRFGGELLQRTEPGGGRRPPAEGGRWGQHGEGQTRRSRACGPTAGL
ncbi:unnamed protein product [Prorocentrum cordatum]|uniref:UBA domain-containing protein n=1 Tax=Prorocentrum cordatum TaxID=2364126 RepID=A0ABN9RYD1_9DINO|nr:unnamed protein product [Polarella glacialis]